MAPATVPCPTAHLHSSCLLSISWEMPWQISGSTWLRSRAVTAPRGRYLHSAETRGGDATRPRGFAYSLGVLHEDSLGHFVRTPVSPSVGVQLGLDGAHHPKPFSTAPAPRANGTPFQNTAESLLCWDSGWLFYQVEDLSVHGPLLILTTLQKFEASVQNIYFQPKQGGYWGPQVVLIYVCGSRESSTWACPSV